jgi:hypothetical protein
LFVLTGIALAIAIGLIAGGRVERLADLSLGWIWVAPIALLSQMAAVNGPSPFSDALAAPLIVGSHVALVAFALRNVRIVGMAVAALGVAMNLAVIVANDGFMPVAPETLQMAGRDASRIGDGSPGTRVRNTKDVIKAREDTWLEPLGDRHWTGLPGRLGVIFSIGDVALLAGVCTLIVQNMRGVPAPRPIAAVPNRHIHNRGVA